MIKYLFLMLIAGCTTYYRAGRSVLACDTFSGACYCEIGYLEDHDKQLESLDDCNTEYKLLTKLQRKE